LRGISLRAVVFTLLAGSVISATAGPTVALELVAGGFDKPLYVTASGDGSGQLFVVEQFTGRVRVILPDGTVQPEPFLDLHGQVSQGFLQGLLGMAFHPHYAENGRCFIYYNRPSDNATVLTQFVRSAEATYTAVDASSEQLIFGPIFRTTLFNNGGMIAFHPSEELLYTTPGDGDLPLNGQRMDTVLGKIVRIDVDHPDPGRGYSIPPDNPFIGQAGVSPEIWATGFRHPWRWSFDRVTGDLWAGDVGQDRVEEIDLVHRGENHGWAIMEGDECFNIADYTDPLDDCDQTGLTLPIFAFPHEPGGEYERERSVTGGYVYRGSAIPELYGVYVFGEFYTGRIYRLDEIAPGVWDRTLLLDTVLEISSFGEDENGEILVCDRRRGNIHRLVPVPVTEPTGLTTR
jgi:glucose/arabinose dehydrogenase